MIMQLKEIHHCGRFTAINDNDNRPNPSNNISPVKDVTNSHLSLDTNLMAVYFWNTSQRFVKCRYGFKNIHFEVSNVFACINPLIKFSLWLERSFSWWSIKEIFQMPIPNMNRSN